VKLLVYTRYELVRTFRNRRLVLLSFGFPVLLYFLIAGPNRHEHDLRGTGISAPVYFMAGLAAFGAMNAVLAIASRVATERSVGWNRQLRLTPLRTRAYFGVKLTTAYAAALGTIALLYAAGAVLGVRLGAAQWLGMTALLSVGLVPVAALGVLLGLVLTADSVGPAIGGTTAILAFLGGTWFPVGNGAMGVIAQALPSYWLVQAAHVGTGGAVWGPVGWLVVASWTACATLLAARAYRRDTERPSA
jgi:ABC-2 type transport system permease protein